MKKIATLLTALVAAIVCFALAACNNGPKPVQGDENTVVITVSSEGFDVANKTLKDYMDYLQEEGELTYEMADGMVTSINGKANTTNSYWMLYTSDAENANNSWGTVEYEGNTYGSAMYGADSLTIKDGCLYIWEYQTF